MENENIAAAQFIWNAFWSDSPLEAAG